ncbi:MAG: Ion transporter [Candidatus Poribacteria bacterium]|nr:Ion transporter [Candidatus Poribacteria bacterium]
MNINRIKTRLYNILEANPDGGLPGRLFGIFIIALISLNVTAVIVETVEKIYKINPTFFHDFDKISVLIFTVEYVLRLWSCTSNSRFQKPIKGRIRFIFTPLAIVDLVSILPFYLPMVVLLDLRDIRALRIFRIFRLLKIGRYFESLKIIGTVFMKKKEELAITLLIVLVLLIIVSSLMYFVEYQAQPNTFSSIPMAMWWGVAALTTVGYGDVYPITPLGKFFGAIIAFLGIGIFALPTGILGAGFVEEIQDRKNISKVCPHCGKEIDDK